MRKKRIDVSYLYNEVGLLSGGGVLYDVYFEERLNCCFLSG
jgi:hypothetical protein